MAKMTIKAAKAIAKEKNGRLPRCGWGTTVAQHQEGLPEVHDWPPFVVGFNVSTVLENVSGTYRVRESRSLIYTM